MARREPALGVVSGGEPGRALCSSDVPPALRARSLTMLALEAVGVAARALELSVGYVADREQFGRRIGTYQAVRHRPPAHADVELARSLAWWAAWVRRARRGGRADRRRRGEGRRGRRGGTHLRARDPGARRHRLHVEHVLHRLYKRALGIQSWEASPAQLRAEVASHLLDRGGS